MPLYTLVAIIAVLASLAFAQSVEIEATADAPLIRVTGDGQVEVAPDRVRLGLGVVADGKTAVDAQQQASGAMTRVIGALQTIGVPPNSDVMVIQTSQIRVSPRYDSQRNRGGEPQIIGYQANQSINVRLDDISKASAAIDAATRAGANQNYGVTFGLQDSASQESEALARAVRDARARAEAIANAAGGTLGPVVLLTEPTRAGGGFVSTNQFMASRAAPASAPPVEGGLLTVTAQVEVTYALTPN